jgi:hypothetical protein
MSIKILSPTEMRKKLGLGKPEEPAKPRVLPLIKGMALPDGTVKNWKGTDYIKKAGKWIPKPKGKGQGEPGAEEDGPGAAPQAKGKLALSFKEPSDLTTMTPEQNREYVEHVKKNYKPSQIKARIDAIETEMEKLHEPIKSGEGTKQTIRRYVNLRHNRDLHEHALGEAKKGAEDSEKEIDDYWDAQGSDDYKGSGLTFDKVVGGSKKKEPDEKPKKKAKAE